MADGTCLLWYRRDLRLHDHPALVAARAYERLVPVFVLDPALLHGRFASAARTRFMLGCLAALDDALRERGSGLVVREGRPEQVIPELAAEARAGAVLWTSDVAPYARGRDARVTEALREAGVEPRPHGGNYVVDVGRPRTQAGDPFRVFSPFHRHWQGLERRTVHRAPAELPALPSGLRKGRLPASVDALGLSTGDLVPEPAVEPGEPAARAALERWLAGPLERYTGETRTSILSPYLRWGCLSPREAEERARSKGGKGAAAWIRQLCWRDFYAHVLLHGIGGKPNPSWDASAELLRAWQRGETGYPAVDAGMRQLARTGWMHNRARLIVGSFLTKDLHIDWREGEAWFERLLLDGEPAQNNGNWQWIASVGVDPAPVYRRLYNPTLQGKRFDPEGTYVRRWIPELRDVPDDKLFEPWTMSDDEQEAAGCVIGRDYPAPVVDHQTERRRALELYAGVT